MRIKFSLPVYRFPAEIGQLAIKNELPAVPVATSSTVGNQSSSFVMDPSDAELIQRHLHEQRGRIGKKLEFFLESQTLILLLNMNIRELL